MLQKDIFQMSASLDFFFNIIASGI